MPSLYDSVIRCRPPRTVTAITFPPAPRPWESSETDRFIASSQILVPTSKVSPDCVGDGGGPDAPYRGNSTVEALVRQLAVEVYLGSPEREADKAGMQRWSACRDDDMMSLTKSYYAVAAGLYVISECWWDYEGWPCIQSEFVPFDHTQPTMMVLDWSADQIRQSAEFRIAFERLPDEHGRMNAALSRAVKSVLQLAEELAVRHCATGQFESEPFAPVITFDGSIADILAVRPHPLIQYGRPENEGHCGAWFTRFANGYLVRLRSTWDVHYAYLDDTGVRFTEGEVLETLYTAHPDLWYEPLDANLQPELHAWAHRIGEEQDDDAYQQVSLLLQGLLTQAT